MTSDLQALRRAANANLVALRDGTRTKQEREARERAAEQKRNEATIRRTEREQRRQLKEELRDLTKLCNHYDRKLTKGVITPEEMGAYEEVDHRREQIMELLDPYVWR